MLLGEPTFVGTTCKSILVGLPTFDRSTHRMLSGIPTFVGTICKNVLVGLPTFDSTTHRMLGIPTFV